MVSYVIHYIKRFNILKVLFTDKLIIFLKLNRIKVTLI